MDTVSWYAEFALRKRVSISATGSVIVIVGFSPSPRYGFPTRGNGVWTYNVVVGLVLNGKPSAFRIARPSSSVFAEVTTVMSIPRTRSIESLIDFVEHGLLGQTEGVVTITVELAVREARGSRGFGAVPG